MSNPSVITLSSTNIKNNVNYRVEDNIGECIHIHYANHRYDLSVSEFIGLESLISESIQNIIEIDGFNLDDYDVKFLASIGSKLIDLEYIAKETIELGNLKVFSQKFGIPTLVSLGNSIIVKALNGDSVHYNQYQQENYFEEKNIDRLNNIKQFIENIEPEEIKPIILFNNQNIIRDGQHRSSILYNNKHKEISVIRLFFRNEKHNISTSPVLNYFFRWDLNRAKNVYRSFRKNIKKIKKRVAYKIYTTTKKYKY